MLTESIEGADKAIRLGVVIVVAFLVIAVIIVHGGSD